MLAIVTLRQCYLLLGIVSYMPEGFHQTLQELIYVSVSGRHPVLLLSRFTCGSHCFVTWRVHCNEALFNNRPVEDS